MSFEDLEDRGLIKPGRTAWREETPQEQARLGAAADRIEAVYGVTVRGVSGTRELRGRTPDAAIIESRVAFEVRTQSTATYGALKNHVRDGRHQSRNVAASGMTREQASSWIARVGGSYADDLDSIVILGDRWEQVWPPDKGGMWP